MQQLGVALEARGNRRMLGPESALQNLQGLLEVLLRLVVLALGVREHRQVVEAGGEGGMQRAEVFLLHLQGPPEEASGFGVPAYSAVKGGEIVEALSHADVTGA